MDNWDWIYTIGDRSNRDFIKTLRSDALYYLYPLLQGKSASADGYIYLDDLYNYVYKNVKLETNRKQIPVLKGESGRIKLSKIR